MDDALFASVALRGYYDRALGPPSALSAPTDPVLLVAQSADGSINQGIP